MGSSDVCVVDVVGAGVAVLSFAEKAALFDGGGVEDEEVVELSRPAVAVELRMKYCGRVPCCLELSSHGLGLARRLRARARTSMFLIRQLYQNVRVLVLGTQIYHLQQQLEGGQAWVEDNGESGRPRGKSIRTNCRHVTLRSL